MVTKADLDMTRMQLENKIDKLEHRLDGKLHRATIFLFSSTAGMVAIAVAIIGMMLKYML